MWSIYIDLLADSCKLYPSFIECLQMNIVKYICIWVFSIVMHSIYILLRWLSSLKFLKERCRNKILPSLWWTHCLEIIFRILNIFISNIYQLYLIILLSHVHDLADFQTKRIMCFQNFVRIERSYGSLFKALIYIFLILFL